MTRRILVSYLLMTLLILAMLTVPLGLTFAARERDRLFTAIERDARVLGAESDDAFESSDFSSLPSLVRRYVAETGGRVVMVDAVGRSVVDSSSLSGPSRQFSSRPEIAAAPPGVSRAGLGRRPRSAPRSRTSRSRSATRARSSGPSGSATPRRRSTAAPGGCGSNSSPSTRSCSPSSRRWAGSSPEVSVGPSSGWNRRPIRSLRATSVPGCRLRRGLPTSCGSRPRSTPWRRDSRRWSSRSGPFSPTRPINSGRH